MYLVPPFRGYFYKALTNQISMIENTLESIGLSKGETVVYLILLKMGLISVGPLVRESKVTKSKVYDILDKLIDKGIVGFVIKDGVKRFSANDPSMLLELVENQKENLTAKQTEIEKLLPQFKEIVKESQEKATVEVYAGFKGLKAIRQFLWGEMQKGDELLVLGAPVIANEKWEIWFLTQHHKRERKSVSLRILYNSNARSYGEKRKKFKLTIVKYMPSGLVTPTWIDVYKDKVLEVTVLEDKPIAVLTRSKTVADSFRAYFETMWKIAES